MNEMLNQQKKHTGLPIKMPSSVSPFNLPEFYPMYEESRGADDGCKWEEMTQALPGPEFCLVPACYTVITEGTVKGNL